jgi:hypothetical protein
MITPERARELMGGLAAGILTGKEQQQLFEAALHDQAIFNEVADELEFAAFLQSPETRAQLANRIVAPPAPRRRWWIEPQWIAVCGAVAAVVLIAIPVWRAHYGPVPALPPVAIARDEIGPPPAFGLRSVAVTPAGAAASKPTVKKKAPVVQNVAVLDFSHAGGNRQSGVQAADVVSQQLAGNGEVNLIDRDKVQQVQAQAEAALPSQGFVAQSGQSQAIGGVAGAPPQSQLDLARTVGQQVGADAVVVGNVEPAAPAGNSFLPRQTVRAEVIDLKQTKSMARAAAAAPSVQRASAMVGSQLQSQLRMNAPKSASGAVKTADGETITVEFGVPWTVRIGDQFDVLRGEEKLGTLVIRSVAGKIASGKFTGTGVPRAGDTVLEHK